MDIHEVRLTIRNCRDRSDNGRSFEAALANNGLVIAQGNRRDFVVIDHEGGLHALASVSSASPPVKLALACPTWTAMDCRP